MLKSYNQLDFEQLGECTVNLGHKMKVSNVEPLY